MIENYKEQKSVIKNIDELKQILKLNGVEDDKIEKIINDYIIKLVPPGTKGVIKGNNFNMYIKECILSLDGIKNEDVFIINFEKKHINFPTDEIPDWYIYNKKKDIIMIGMNQLDLWSGDQQINRGFKYINIKNDEKSKIVCVVCNLVLLKKIKLIKYMNFLTMGLKINGSVI